MPAFRVKLGANDLNCVDVPLNPAHSLTHHRQVCRRHCFQVVNAFMHTSCYMISHKAKEGISPNSDDDIAEVTDELTRF